MHNAPSGLRWGLAAQKKFCIGKKGHEKERGMCRSAFYGQTLLCREELFLLCAKRSAEDFTFWAGILREPTALVVKWAHSDDFQWEVARDYRRLSVLESE
jgi:hypothetical protein